MSTTTTLPPDAAPRAPTDATTADQRRRALRVGVGYLLVGLVIGVYFGLGADAGLTSELRLNINDPAITIPDLAVPTRATNIVLALLCGGLGIVQLTRGLGRHTPSATAVVIFALTFAFLVFTARDASFSFVGMLTEAITRAMPLAVGALAGILCERAGIINIAIEGMMLTAAFTGAVVGSVAGNLYVGLGAAILSGALAAGLFALFSIRYEVDQIIGGTALNILALGLTAFLAGRLSDIDADLVRSGTFAAFPIPLLADLPFLGPILFDQTLFVYAMYALVAWFAYALFHTRWGLRLRACGEHPRAADTVGINVRATRYRAVILGGALAGIAGAYLTLGSTGGFEEGMTAGRGFIALAAVIFGRWRPLGALSAALLFGFAESLQPKLAILGSPLPSEFLAMAPYVVTIVAVAGLVGASRAPAAEGKPYP